MENIENSSQQKFIISSSPHLLKDESTRSIMWLVIMGLLPATIFGVYAFGFSAFLVLFVSILTCVITEASILKLRKRNITLDDGSAILTGLLIGLNMPPTVPLYIPIISSIFGIAIVKQVFGGLGENWANPAIAARVFALFAWTKHMTTWISPFMMDTVTSASSYDSLTTATPLGIVKSAVSSNPNLDFSSTASGLSGYFQTLTSGPMNLLSEAMGRNVTYSELFFGFKGGCIGEISVFLILIGALYLIYRKIITLDIPIAYIGTVIIIAWIFDGPRYGKGLFQGDFIFHLLTGGLALGAFFMATDMVTTPITVKGRLIFGMGCGIVTMLIRLMGGLPEGVSLSILFMNMLTPAIDRFVRVKPLGYIKE